MAKKISVIIPNFNGKKLLKQNLSVNIEKCEDCEVIIVDDASTDNSVKYIKENFKKVILIELTKNKGFAHSINSGVKKASGELLLFLNTDVVLENKININILERFKNNKLFALALADISHENEKKILRGRGGAKFSRGFLSHFAINSNKSGKTLWVSGGSGIFDKNKFNQLGGYDEDYAPFYWEDIDLCYRAWKSGYLCQFDSGLKVNHFHEKGAIKSSKSESFIKIVSYKNQFLFVWKNISDYNLLIRHILWLPYHLLLAMIKLNIPFLLGFLWAIATIPKLILSDNQKLRFKIDDKEVLRKIEK